MRKSQICCGLVFAADNFIAENGSILAHSAKFDDGFIIHDVDIEKLMQQRRRQNTYPDFTTANYKRIFVPLQKEIAYSGFILKYANDQAF